MFSKSDLEDIEHADQIPKWAQSILQIVDSLMDDPIDHRGAIFQFEGEPHVLTTTKLVMCMHCYIVLAFNPQEYAEDEGNLYCKISMNEEDLDLLLSNQRKWIYVDISLVHLLHHIHTNIYIFN
jgi:hypothetical protein